MGYKEIIEKNNRILHRIPKKYKYLRQLFQGNIEELYFLVMKYIKPKDLYHPRPDEGQGNKLLFHMSCYELVKQRGRGAYSTVDNHINFLCAMGVIRKYNGREETTINQNFKKNRPPEQKGINTFYILSFDPNGERLTEIDQRCKDLIEHKITKGNIEGDLLRGRGLSYLANEVYFDTHSGIENKSIRYNEICELLDNMIAIQGFATKQDIYDNLFNIGKSKIDRALKQFEIEFHADYNYKRPTKEQKAKYHLVNDSWIITKKEG